MDKETLIKMMIDGKPIILLRTGERVTIKCIHGERVRINLIDRELPNDGLVHPTTAIVSINKLGVLDEH